MVLPKTRALDRVEVVRRHRFDTIAYLVTAQPNCLAIARLESQKVTGRRLKLLEVESLPSAGDLPPSWLVAVLLCPDDTTELVAAWTKRLPPALRGRVWFYEAPGIDATRAYDGWKKAGLGNPLADPFTDFLDFNRLFANGLNEQIYQDHQLER